MIGKFIILIYLLTLLPFLYVDLSYVRGGKRPWFKRMLLWLPATVMVALSTLMAWSKEFVVSYTLPYFLLLAIIVVPMLVFMISSVIGRAAVKLLHTSRNYGNSIGILLIFGIWYIVAYGTTVGFSQVAVKHAEYSSPHLPAAFDGYRIVQISDFHLGTYGSSKRQIVQAAIDSVNAQQADLVVFTGDLQNNSPNELNPYMKVLSSIKSKDGVMSVMGNHDYADYISGSEAEKDNNIQLMRRLQRQLGWQVLENDNKRIYRDSSYIVIAGMENDGDGKHFKSRGDITKATRGIISSDFVVMLQHDPTSWRRTILPSSHAQLTLSGHTHAMQFKLFGWSPSSIKYSEWGGMFREGSRAIYVNTGLGGVLPFRFGVPGEVTVITLRKD